MYQKASWRCKTNHHISQLNGKSIFLTATLQMGAKQIGSYNIEKVGYAAIHSLFIATYLGRLRVTLQPLPDIRWHPGAGTKVTTNARGVETAKNFEGLTGIYLTPFNFRPPLIFGRGMAEN